MCEAKLPEELLREILSLRLSLSEKQFCKFHSAFGSEKYSPQSSSDILLVSKRWLRIGTPLLYESVHIWNTGCTKTVASLVRSNPVVGKAIRRLRIEGGCGKDLYTIVEHAPNIRTLYINSYFKTAEGITGLRKALPVMRPEKLYFHFAGPGPRLNKAVVEAKALLDSCIADSWTSLVSTGFLSHSTLMSNILHRNVLHLTSTTT